jgi:O-methyltransferase domain/Dimerisation domain
MATASHPQSPPSPALIWDTFQAYQRTAALHAAIELDLFRFIGEGPGSVASLAQRCSASERGVRILCDFLCIIGFLEKHDGQYRNSPTSATFLDPRSPACIASMARFLSTPVLQEPFDHLAEIVRSGRTTLPGDGSVEPDNPVWVDFAHAMAPLMTPVAGPLAALVLEGRSGPVHVLDIAAGHGLFGIAVAAQAPQARIVALDWAAVLQVAKANAQKAGVADRVQMLPGSAFTVDYGGPYDIVLLTNFLHHFDPPTCVELLRKIHSATKSGGCVAALEFVPNDDRISPPAAAAFSMTMLGSTPSGDAYTFNELAAMYQQAGFVRITQHPIPPSPHTAVIGYVA